jgi:transcriptional regulator with XRE-family HTH domain
MADNESIGARIRRYREDRGMSATQLAERAEISKSYLSELENPGDGTKQPSADKLYAIADALGVAMSDLLGRRIIIAPPTTPPASLGEFIAVHPEIPEADVEMLSQIQFRGESPKSLERWEFIYQAIRNSEAMDD